MALPLRGSTAVNDERPASLRKFRRPCNGMLPAIRHPNSIHRSPIYDASTLLASATIRPTVSRAFHTVDPIDDRQYQQRDDAQGYVATDLSAWVQPNTSTRLLGSLKPTPSLTPYRILIDVGPGRPPGRESIHVGGGADDKNPQRSQQV